MEIKKLNTGIITKINKSGKIEVYTAQEYQNKIQHKEEEKTTTNKLLMFLVYAVLFLAFYGTNQNL